MPEEVVDVWLKQYVEDLGWPPLHDRWRGILGQRSVAFWARVVWRHESGPLDPGKISGRSQGHLSGMKDAYIRNIQNDYWREIEDGKKRLGKILAFVRENGRVPGPLVFLETGSVLSVVDGHHRLLAYFMSRDPEWRKQYFPGWIQFDATMEKWIGTHCDRPA